MHSHTHRVRRGFSLIEMLMVMIVMGVILAIALPKSRTLSIRAAVSSAKQQLAARMETARAYAVLNGTTTQLKFAADDVWITRTKRNGTSVTVKTATSFQKAYDVALTLPDGVTEIDYDPRGVATSLSGPVSFRLSRSTTNDSVCVSRLGLVTSNCGL